MNRLKDYLNNDQIKELEESLRVCALGKPFSEKIMVEIEKTFYNFLMKYKHQIPEDAFMRIIDYWFATEN